MRVANLSNLVAPNSLVLQLDVPLQRLAAPIGDVLLRSIRMTGGTMIEFLENEAIDDRYQLPVGV